MSKTYEFLQETPPEQDAEQQTIVEKEVIYTKDADGKYVEKETKESRFTIAQKEEQLANIDRQIASLQAQRKEIADQISEIKTARI